jgi:putative ATP-dependent endonuclease of OLD family
MHFDGHTLLVGTNNVGKSTICEALDLVLGPDRLNRFPPIDEFDFPDGKYLESSAKEGEEAQALPLRIEVVLRDLTDEVATRCANHLELWHPGDRRLLASGELKSANPPETVLCLRLVTVGRYSIEEDEFEANTFFAHSPDAEAGELTPVRRDIKRQFGFLYLRALRTGSRALTLERGSLLDIILRLKSIRTGLWEQTIRRLRDLDIEDSATELAPVLRSIETRLGRYVATDAAGRTTRLFVSQLTREHLRKTMSFFMAMSKDQAHVPFQHVGTGTLNTLVLALLSFIADLKPETIIFAMEEPEIAVPPHTQRRIADYLLKHTSQAFVTSHSPYVIERFSPEQTIRLTREDNGTVVASRISDVSGLKDNDYKRYARRGLAESMLGCGVIVVEGVTEAHALPVVAERRKDLADGRQPLDLLGVTVFDADGDGNLIKFGTFFKSMGLRTFALYDKKTRKAEEVAKLAALYEVNTEHPYPSVELLLAMEVSADRLWAFLDGLRAAGENGSVGIPAARPTDEKVRDCARAALASNKGAGWAARLLESCTDEEMPSTLVAFVESVFNAFPVEVVGGDTAEDAGGQAPDADHETS